MIEIEVNVRKTCSLSGSSWTDVKITEDDILRLAEQKAAELYMPSKTAKYTADELKVISRN